MRYKPSSELQRAAEEGERNIARLVAWYIKKEGYKSENKKKN